MSEDEEPIDWTGRIVYDVDGRVIPPPIDWTGRKLLDVNGNEVIYENRDIDR
jgi:hypothetical protein